MFRLSQETFDFNLHIFYLKGTETLIHQTINCSEDFCEKVNNDILKFKVRDSAAFIVKCYFENLNFKVVENINKPRLGQPDLIVQINENKIFVEAKNYKDKLSYHQMKELVKKEHSRIVWVIPKRFDY